ncbi:type II secretion system protein N [Luteimonas terrae]|uniref:General secretion pathway protein C n=1 Tax=Luteimonas terrae TaxID=1530191 RepID=A0ABU1Y048_9GAMM|nr:type II secretion system protein N [Luteimonas terrae]MDR7194399.1 general secretion pathway protein C [Luteimonas terrae]
MSRWPWPRLAEIVLWLVLLTQLARLAWLVLAPASVAGTPQVTSLPSQIPELAAHDPFLAGASAAPVATDGWRLFGLRTAADGRGTAILGRDREPQSVYGVGDVLAPGLVLAAVRADHVELGNGQRLALAQEAPADAPAASMPAPPPSPTPVPARSADFDPAQLLEAGLQARTVDGRLAGYTLLPRGNSDVLLRAAGLQPGDVLLSVNGQVLSPSVITELASELKSNPRAIVTFERDGQTRTLSLGGDAP